MSRIKYNDLRNVGLNMARFNGLYCDLGTKQNLYSLLSRASGRLRALHGIKQGLALLITQLSELIERIEVEIKEREAALRVLSTEGS